MAQNLTYTRCGDYLIPDIRLSYTSDKPLGKYGRMRRAYLEQNNPMLLDDLILTETLFPHLWKIDEIYASNTSIEAFLNLDYAQFIAVKDFLHPEAQYSTEHGVKGEEYDNVIFVISKGWNQYQFETYAPMITKKAVIPSGKQASFERNRNLFYVCCSRPKKRLIFFVTVPIDSTFKSFLVELVGEQNIFTFSQYIERKSIK